MKTVNNADELSEEEIDKEYAFRMPVSVKDLRRGVKMGDFLYKGVEAVFPFLKVKDENHLTRKDMLRMSLKLSFLVASACLFAVEILMVPIVLFNSKMDKFQALVSAPLILIFILFLIFLVAGLIVAGKWDVKSQSIK